MSEASQVRPSRRRPDFYPDDWKERHGIDATADHGAHEIELKLIDPRDWGRLVDSTRAGDEAFFRTGADVLARNLASWTIKNAKGEAVPINAENVLRLNRHLLRRMIEIALGVGDDNQPAESAAAPQATKVGALTVV